MVAESREAEVRFAVPEADFSVVAYSFILFFFKKRILVYLNFLSHPGNMKEVDLEGAGSYDR